MPFHGEHLAVIGTGIAAACFAHQAAKAGYQVDVYEQAALSASGASGNAAGIVRPKTNPNDERYALFQEAKRAFDAMADTWQRSDICLYRGVYHQSTGWVEDAIVLNPSRWIAALLKHPNIHVHHLSPWHRELAKPNQALIYCMGWESYLHNWPLGGGYRQVQWTRFEDIQPPPSGPIIGNGYLCPLSHRQWLVGAAHGKNFDLNSSMLKGHIKNLEVLQDLHPRLRSTTARSGRQGVRCSVIGRWPVVGALPDFEWAQTAYKTLYKGHRPSHYEPLRYQPNQYLITALGARGLLLAPLCAHWLLNLLQYGESPPPKTAAINGLLRQLRKRPPR